MLDGGGSSLCSNTGGPTKESSEVGDEKRHWAELRLGCIDGLECTIGLEYSCSKNCPNVWPFHNVWLIAQY